MFSLVFTSCKSEYFILVADHRVKDPSMLQYVTAVCVTGEPMTRSLY